MARFLRERRDRYIAEAVLKGRMEEETEDDLWKGSLWVPGPVTGTRIHTDTQRHACTHA